jgi:hypothetical protein
MVNTLLFKHKALGSAALRCGASSFGVKNMGNLSKYPSLFVSVFKSQEKRNKFLSFLRSQNLTFQTDFYYRYVIHNNEFLYLVFVKLYKFIPSQKLGFNNFRQFCSSQQINVYSNSCYSHPHAHINKKTLIN